MSAICRASSGLFSTRRTLLTDLFFILGPGFQLIFASVLRGGDCWNGDGSSAAKGEVGIRVLTGATDFRGEDLTGVLFETGPFLGEDFLGEDFKVDIAEDFKAVGLFDSTCLTKGSWTGLRLQLSSKSESNPAGLSRGEHFVGDDKLKSV